MWIEKPTISERLEKFFESKQANYLMFTWAALEAIIWFVIPEFLLLLMVFLRVRNKVQLLIYDILGTIVGTCIAFFIPFHSNSFITNIPYIQTAMIKQTEAWYTYLGVWGLFFQPFSGVPYKVFTLTADRSDFFLPVFLVIAVVARVSRYYFFYFMFTNIYPFVHRFVYKNYVPLFFIAGLLFTIALLRVYGLYDENYVVINEYPFLEKYKMLFPSLTMPY